MTKLILLHQLGAGLWSGSDLTDQFAIFKTCLRQVAVGFVSENHKSDHSIADVRVEQEAYRFLLSVICGLESPLIGETEVFGQFKSFAEEQMKSADPAMRNLLSSLLRDAKAIRHQHLSGLGCQSYGSWIRKQIRENESLAMIGRGELAREILPWLKKQNLKLEIFTRGGKITENFSDIPHRSFEDDLVCANGIVIAAPISAKQIISRLSKNNAIRLVIDLRGESVDDPLVGDFAVVNLHQVMEELAKDRHVVHQRGQLAGADVARAAENFHRQVKIRPLGWDDLCA